MATAPQIKLRDGSGFTQSLVFTTNQDFVVLEGTISVDTADVQVSINGGPFVSDANLVRLDLQTFTLPNPSTYPSGLPLDIGLNTIAIRTVDIVGSVSAPSTATVTRVQSLRDVVAEIPSGVHVRRRRDAVDLLAAKPAPFVTTSSGVAITQPSITTLIGFNFYASDSPSGGTTGYIKINEKPVIASSVYEESIFTVFEDTTTWSQLTGTGVRIEVVEDDNFDVVTATRLNQRYSTVLLTGSLRFKSTIESFRLTEFVSFRHFRSGGPNTINADQFASVADTSPLYYVVTGVYYDPVTNEEVETSYSQEVVGLPLIIDTAVRDLPTRTSLDVTREYIRQVLIVNREISLIPGSTTRDVSVDPFASEAERLWFIVDFVHRSGSFLTLLQIDDADGNGISDPVAGSAYKQALKAALGFSNDDAVQTLIDQQFGKLAANVNKTRLPGRAAVGQAIIYTSTRPTTDITIPAGTFVSTDADTSNNLPSVRFRIGGSYILPAASADAFFNFDTKRYEITVDIVAESIGETGNRPAGTIKNISGIAGVFVTNTSATVFGADRESNADLAARAMLAFASVDTGTEGGYASTAAEQVGVIKAKIVKSGDPLMMRDYDDVRHKHIGGKVDIWVQGLRERQVSERFAFTFDIAKDIICQIVDIPTLTFRVLDSRVTPDTPIVEILNNLSQGLGVRNTTIGQDYDLTGVSIIDYRTFQLNTAISQPTTSTDDVIVADYRFRAVNQFRFTLQPVRRVVSVVGEVSGALDPTLGYNLYKTDDPLLTGESTIAKDYLAINQIDNIPSGDSISVSAESHVLIGFVQEPLNSIGINTKTIRVFSADRTIEYDGPTAAVPDFEIIDGTATTPVKIVRTASSEIRNGEAVSVDYAHDENFTVVYVINDVLQELQQTVDARRHTTADVLVKQSVDNKIDIENTVQLTKGASKDRVDPAIRSNVSTELDRKTIGQGLSQSDVIRTVDSTDGVNFSPVPYARLAYADGSRKLRETVLSTFTRVGSLDLGANRAYLLSNPLQYPTTDGGGQATEHRGVFQDDEAMNLSSALASVCSLANQAFIIGSGGALIQGYSDDTTLTNAGFTTSEDRAEERLRRTANHIVVSLSGAGTPPDEPTNHKYAVSYIIRGDSGAHDITASDVETIALGGLTITFRTA
jgi:hypothetical protein